MDLSELGEFGLIRRIREGEAVPEGVEGIGDDCAVLPQREGFETLVTTDLLTEGVHFLREDADPRDLGWKAAAVNLSDIAAMGGRPVGSFLAFALPKGLDSIWMDAFIEGYRDVSALSATPLLGGDTTSSKDGLCICVTVVGECATGTEVRRSGARPGDLVCVTGTLGDSAGGLKVILEGLPRGRDEKALVDRHYRPVPRIPEGQAVAAGGATAMMDISDGIGSDLGHILESSGVGARIDVDLLPLSEQLRRCCGRYGWDPYSLAIDGGEDYELLFTMPPEAEKRLTLAHTVIGEITAESGCIWEGSSQEHRGYKHF